MSSDSQYEFSNYSNNRKDSTSTTGRLSFSSENPTKSTSSSFLSSGIWNFNNRSALTEDNNELILSQDQYQRLIKFSNVFNNKIMENNDLDYKLLNILNQTNDSPRYIILIFTEQELFNMIAEKDAFGHNPMERIKQLNNSTKLMDDDRSNYANNENVSDNIPVFYVLFLLDKIEPLMLGRNEFIRNKLEIIILLKNNFNVDLELFSKVQYQSCIVQALFEELWKYINNYHQNNFNDDSNFETLTSASLIFNTQFRLVKKVLDEINEETNSLLTNNGGSNNRLEDPNKKSQTSKMMSNSHERIMNFLQILLPKSNKQNNVTKSATSSSSSFYRKHRVKKPQSVVTKSISSGQRRSSSAFALSDEVLKNIQQNSYDKSLYVKSCSHLNGIESSISSNSRKSDSIPEIRSQSAISDVIIRINDGSSQDVNQSTTQIIIARDQTASDREISYSSLNGQNLKLELDGNKMNERYHSYEFIA